MQDYYPVTCFNLALALMESGETREAREIAEEGINDLKEKVGGSQEAAWIPLLMAKLELASGRADKIDDYLRKAKSLGVEDQGALVYLAEVYALSGRKQEAIDTLRGVLESGYSDPYFLQIYPAFHSLQGDPGFHALFR